MLKINKEISSKISEMERKIVRQLMDSHMKKKEKMIKDTLKPFWAKHFRIVAKFLCLHESELKFVRVGNRVHIEQHTRLAVRARWKRWRWLIQKIFANPDMIKEGKNEKRN